MHCSQTFFFPSPGIPGYLSIVICMPWHKITAPYESFAGKGIDNHSDRQE